MFPPRPDRRLVLRAAGGLSSSPQRRKAKGEPDVIDREAMHGPRGVARCRDFGRRPRRPSQGPATPAGRGDVAFRHLTRSAALAVLVILGGIIVSLVWGSLPALRTFGVSFLYEEVGIRSPKFGAITPIFGTIITSFIAMPIAVPLGLFIALFLTELCPCGCAAHRYRHRAAGPYPSIIYGIWGLFVFAPFLQPTCSRH